MFLVDRLLLSLGERILEAAEAEGPSPEKVRVELQELYRRLASGQLTEAEFEQHEAVLLSELEELERARQKKKARS